MNAIFPYLRVCVDWQCCNRDSCGWMRGRFWSSCHRPRLRRRTAQRERCPTHPPPTTTTTNSCTFRTAKAGWTTWRRRARRLWRCPTWRWWPSRVSCWSWPRCAAWSACGWLWCGDRVRTYRSCSWSRRRSASTPHSGRWWRSGTASRPWWGKPETRTCSAIATAGRWAGLQRAIATCRR